MNRKLPDALPGVIALVGDEAFLRRETLNEIAKVANLSLDDIRTFDGQINQWSQVHDELATMSMFEAEAIRVAIVADADDLVSKWRVQLEKWCESPADGSLLILQLETLAANTKLYKIISKHGWLIACTLPPASRGKGIDEGELRKWIGEWALSRHALKLKAPQCKLILDAVGPNCGLLHQELSKLALYSDGETIDDASIREHVGSWTTRTMWEIADSILDGKVADALLQLERVFAAGQQPAGVIPQISWSLRRYGQAAQLVLQSRRQGRPMTADEAVKLCGFWGAELLVASGRLRRVGLPRASKLLDWLLELDLKVKGSHSSQDRATFALEELCLRFI